MFPKQSFSYLLWPVFILAVSMCPLSRVRGESQVAVDWPAFLAQQDLVWDESLPNTWSDSAFLGNGNLGATIYMEEGKLTWTINQTDVYYAPPSLMQSRYPIGRLALVTQGQVEGGEARLDLWNAEAYGTIRTTRGGVHWKSFCSRDPSVLVVELSGSDGESDCRLEWLPEEALPPRPVFNKKPIPAQHQHPAVKVEQTSEGITSVQQFRGGSTHAESIREVAQGTASRVYYISIGHAENAEQALAQALKQTQSAFQTGVSVLKEREQDWWHRYYPESFLSVPDATLQAFYWIQMYKLGAGMREDGPMLDLMGPWYYVTPWPAIWWDLNAQLTYMPLFTANRLPLSESLFSHLDRNKENLLNNVSPSLRGKAAAIGCVSGPDMSSPVHALRSSAGKQGPDMGNLPWTMYLYWLYYRYTMDEEILRDRVYPLLKPSINHYLAILKKGPDGLWHLPPTYSPELATVADSNYDLALLRWGLQTLIQSCAILDLDDPELPRWRETLAHLAPPPVDDATGLMIGQDYPLERIHRHYSHLLGIYPLTILTPDTSENRELIKKSLENWIHRGNGYTGYSYTGAASMYALLGDGEQALACLNRTLKGFVRPNTFYREAGPCIETPLSAATSLQEMLLQSWGGALRIFPAIPPEWEEVSFDSLRAEGAFLVSAVRSGGKTQWIRIESLAGAPCTFHVPDWDRVVVRAASGESPAIRELSPGKFSISLQKGDWVIVSPSSSLRLEPIQPVVQSDNPFPSHK